MLRRSARRKILLRHRSPRFCGCQPKGWCREDDDDRQSGACFAELGRRVLIIDLDPQANASTGLGLNPRQLTIRCTTSSCKTFRWKTQSSRSP